MGAPVRGHFAGGASGLTMRWPSIILLRARSLFERQSMEQELDEELRYHVERQIEEDIAAGMSREEARRAALRRRFGTDTTKGRMPRYEGIGIYWTTWRRTCVSPCASCARIRDLHVLPSSCWRLACAPASRSLRLWTRHCSNRCRIAIPTGWWACMRACPCARSAISPISTTSTGKSSTRSSRRSTSIKKAASRCAPTPAARWRPACACPPASSGRSE